MCHHCHNHDIITKTDVSKEFWSNKICDYFYQHFLSYYNLTRSLSHCKECYFHSQPTLRWLWHHICHCDVTHGEQWWCHLLMCTYSCGVLCNYNMMFWRLFYLTSVFVAQYLMQIHMEKEVLHLCWLRMRVEII